jgi:hypothetical protein
MTPIPIVLPTTVPVHVVQMPDDSLNVALTTYGTLAAAFLALAALVSSWYYNRKMYEESRTNNERTLRDAQLDRETGWKPHLAFNNVALEPQAPDGRIVSVSNIGKGPALECRYFGRIMGAAAQRYFRAASFAVGAEAELKTPRCVVELDPNVDADGVKFATRAFSELSDDRREVLLCSDAYGNLWRFVRGRALPDGPIRRADIREHGPATTWWQGWDAGAKLGLWVQRARDAEDAVRAEERRRCLRRDARAAYTEYLSRYREFAIAFGLLEGLKTGAVASLTPAQENTVRQCGEWADLVAERIAHGDLDHEALVENSLIARLLEFRSAALADANIAPIARMWTYLDKLTP